MAVYKQKKSKNWWYKFTWNGKLIRESTKQTNQRVARQMEATHKAALAKGEVGIRERKPIPTLREFAQSDFLPFVRSTFAAKLKTKAYYEYGVKSLLNDERLSSELLDAITSEKVAGYIAKRQEAKLQVASINRELQVLRRMLYLAQEWGKVDKVLPKVRMLSGERHRERVLSPAEERNYLDNAEPLLHDVATILLDCGLRPEECFRLRWENIGDGYIEIQYGKTDNARRRVPVSPRIAAVLEMRRTYSTSDWLFPAGTASGHIEPASIKRQHLKACKGPQDQQSEADKPKWAVEPFPLYTLRHTCLTRWAPHMDPWALAYVAGHRDMSITKRYVHPQQDTLRNSMEKARVANSGHTSGHTGQAAGVDTTRDTAPTA